MDKQEYQKRLEGILIAHNQYLDSVWRGKADINNLPQTLQAICLLNEEAIGADDVQKPTTDDADYSYCETCEMCFFDDDPTNGCECTSRNRTKQELKQIIGVSNE